MRHQRLWLSKRATPSTRLNGDQHGSEAGDRLLMSLCPWVTKWAKFLWPIQEANAVIV